MQTDATNSTKVWRPFVIGKSAIDLLQAAWRLEDEEFERLLRVETGWLREWRNHEVTLSDSIIRRFKILLSVHEAVRLHTTPDRYGGYVTRKWSADSLIGEQSILEVIQEESSENIERVVKYLWAVAAGN